MKLVMNRYSFPEKCTVCRRIDTKQRAISMEEDRIRRWRKEAGRGISITKAQDNIYRLEYEIERLKNDLAMKNSSLDDGG